MFTKRDSTTSTWRGPETNLTNLFQFENAVARLDSLVKMEQVHVSGLGEENGVGAYPDIDFDEEIGWLDEAIDEFQKRVQAILNRAAE